MKGGLATALTAAAGTLSTVGGLFRARAQIQKSALAIEFGERKLSYGELLDRVDRATLMLADRGLERGDRVALLSRNRPEYFEIELAAANLGAITACLNWRLSKREIAYCVDLVSPRFLIVEDELAASSKASTGLNARPSPLAPNTKNYCTNRAPRRLRSWPSRKTG